MTSKIMVNLDAMIPRADFALTGKGSSAGEKIASLGVEQLAESSMVIKNLRKPDFQRETNNWSPLQLVTFLKSYVDRELIPSVILWQSPSFIYVIDGAHRLSALRAWIEDDYGDGNISHQFYGNEIPDSQKRIASKVRRLVEQEIGKFQMLKSAVGQNESYSPQIIERASNTASRTFALQWVEGDAEKAETSFFKINTQGTPLHKTEERLLRDRHKPIAISARAIVRAGTGNKYWSQFAIDEKNEIEQLSKSLHSLLFQPEVQEPVKTLDLPLGGASSPVESLNLLMDFIQVATRSKTDNSSEEIIFKTDEDGRSTIATLQSCLKVMRRISGNSAGSLGLHPAIYFYNNKGKHSQYLFHAIISIFAKHIHQNDKTFFNKFTKIRESLEEFLIKNKPLLGQAIVALGSTSRVPRLIEMYEELIKAFSVKRKIDSEDLLRILKLQGKLLAEDIEAAKTEFDANTKSEIFLKTSLESAVKCPICKGYVDVTKSVSYDHIMPKNEGGKGSFSNGQITHPFCNTGIKH